MSDKWVEPFGAPNDDGGVPVDDLTADDLRTLDENRRAAGAVLDELIAMMRGHREETNCRMWGCWGAKFSALLAEYEPHQVTQMLVCAAERLTTTDRGDHDG